MNITNKWYDIKKNKYAYLWISPFFLLNIIFWLGPIIYSFIISFNRWHIFGNPLFVGFGNYFLLFQDERFWRAFYNSFYLLIVIVPLRTLMALILAVLLNSSLITKFKGFLRSIIILPYITSKVIVSVVFIVLFAQQGGLVNVILSIFKIPPIPWLNSTEWSKISVSLVIFWLTQGYFTIIMLGGLQRIPKELYEAARIDGARPFDEFTKITVPLMKPITAFVLIISTIEVFKTFEIPFVLTKGGPQYSSTTLSMLLYNNAFDYFRLGYASSIAVVIFIVALILSIFQLKLTGE